MEVKELEIKLETLSINPVGEKKKKKKKKPKSDGKSGDESNSQPSSTQSSTQSTPRTPKTPNSSHSAPQTPLNSDQKSEKKTNGNKSNQGTPKTPNKGNNNTPIKSGNRKSPNNKVYDSPKSRSPRSNSSNLSDFSQFVTFTNGNLISVLLADRRISAYSLENLTLWLQIRIRAMFDRFSGSPEKPSGKESKLRMHMELQENNIDDEGIEILVNFLVKNQDAVVLKKLKLWNNKIGDKGAFALANLIEKSPYAITEVHLSHNRITVEGAKKLLEAVSKCGHYPRNIGVKEVSPLWMRLEWNFIENIEMKKFLQESKITVCYATDRNLCGPANCVHGINCPIVHLYVLDLQFKAVEHALSLQTAKQKIRESRKSTKEGEPQQIPPVPTYIFLDTCAVLNMIDPTQLSINSFNYSHTFTFKNLISKSKEKNFGDGLEFDGDKVYLIITDTVMQEIDSQKKSRPEARFSIVKYLQSEEGYLNQCVRLNFLEVLGAHQGEILLKMTDNVLIDTTHITDRNLENDLMLLNVALFWNNEIGMSGNVIVISADEEVKRRAKLHNLPAELLKVLDLNLSKVDKDKPWSASVLKSCIPKAFEKKGKPMGTPIQATSIYKEMESAIQLTKEMSGELKFFMENSKDSDHVQNSSELLRKVEEKLVLWEGILKERPSTLKTA